MKVYITAIPGYSIENLIQVISLLSEIRGEITYSMKEEPIITPEQMTLIDDKFENLDEIKSLSFEDFFNIADKYRVIRSIPKEDIVVVLSPIKHNRNWFSGVSNKNIFVNTQGWEYLTNNDSKYGIAYQIIENIFQLLVGIEYDTATTDPNIHHTSIGCVNDYCKNKLEVVSKLRNAYICYSCQQRAVSKNVNKAILSQIISTLQKIREGLMNFDLIKNIIEPLPTLVSENGGVKIGDREISMAALPRSLFIFFLAHIDGINVVSLNNQLYKEEIWYIYHKLRPSAQKKSVDTLCLHYTNEDSTFFKVRYDANIYLIDKLDRVLSEYYTINNERTIDKGLYKIQLPPNYLTFKLLI